MAIKLLVVDDHPVARMGVQHMTIGSDIQIVAQADNAESALHHVRTMELDLVLLDVRMPQKRWSTLLG